jgi:hypothetical protein
VCWSADGYLRREDEISAVRISCWRALTSSQIPVARRYPRLVREMGYGRVRTQASRQYTGLSLKNNESLLVKQTDHIAIVDRQVDLRRREALTRLGGIEREKGEDQERRGEEDEEMRGISVVLYTASVDVYVHRMKTVALRTSRPGSAYAKRIAIRISSSIFPSASVADL